MAGEIQKTEHHNLVAGGEDAVAALFLPGSIGQALSECGITPAYIVRELAEILKTDRLTVTSKGDERFLVSPKERMAAAKMLLDIAEKSAHVSGLIERITGHAERELPDGTRTTMDVESMRMLKEGSSRMLSTLKALQDHSEGRETIDLEPEDANRTRYSVPTPEIDRPVGSGRGVPQPSSSGSGCGRESISDGDEPGGDCVDGCGDVSGVHGEERPDPCPSPKAVSDNDQATTGGAEDERSSRISEQLRRSVESEVVGGDRSPGDGAEPPTIGEVEWWNETRSPAGQLCPDPKPQPHPFIPGGERKVESTSGRVLREGQDEGCRSTESITERLRKLYGPKASGGQTIKRSDDGGGNPSPSVDGTHN